MRRRRPSGSRWPENEPKLTFDGYAIVHELVYAPWVGKDGKLRRAFKAEGVEPVSTPKQSQHAA